MPIAGGYGRGTDKILSEFIFSDPGSGKKTPMYQLENGRQISQESYNNQSVAGQENQSYVLEGGGATRFSQQGSATGQTGQVQSAPELSFAPPQTQVKDAPLNQDNREPTSFQGNKQTAYGPAGQYPAMAQNMGGQSGFTPAPTFGGGGGFDFGQGVGGYDSGGDFAPPSEAEQIQQQSQPAKPGMTGGPTSGFGPYPATPWGG